MNSSLIKATPVDIQRMEAEIQAANAISRSLLFSLERQYLDTPFEDATFLQPGPRNIEVDAPYFLRLEQVGNGSYNQPLTAIQTALTACHNPGQHTLIFLIASDGNQNQIYLGVRGTGVKAYTGEFINYLGSFLEGNWPGTRLRPCSPQDEQFTRHIVHPLQQMKCATALTGIPSLKLGDQPGYPQSLDRLLRGLRGVPFLYMVVAEPLSQAHINHTIDRCRELVGHIHTLAKTTLNETLSAGFSVTEQDGVNWNQSFGYSENMTVGNGRQTGMNLGLGILAGAIASVFPPAGLLSSLALATGVLLTPTAGFSHQQSQSNGTSFINSLGGSHSHATGITSSTAQALGREYINTHAQAAVMQLQAYINRFEQARSSGCWNVGVYFLGEQHQMVQQGGNQLRSLLSGQKSSFEPIRVHNLARLWTRGVRSALQEFEQPGLGLMMPSQAEQNSYQRLEHPLGAIFNGLTTPLNTEELALLINLPRREMPGVRLSATADFTLNPPSLSKHQLSLHIGNLLEGGEETLIPYPLPLAALAKHALLTGITGSGKSTTCRHLLQEIQKADLPFLVIEPAKTEYVDWALRFNQTLSPNDPNRIQVFMPGRSNWRGEVLTELHLNPLDLVWLTDTEKPQVLTHIDRLKSILNASFPMQEVLPMLLEDALFDSYQRKGWFNDLLANYNMPRPTLSDLLNRIPDLVRGKGYDKPITANLTAALMTRIESLRRGWKQQLFDQATSTPWSEIFDRPAVINLSYLGDDADKAFTMAILLQFLYEYRQAQQILAQCSQPFAAMTDHLRHLTVVEEAHRILLKSLAPTLEQASPQAKVAEMFANILSEIRSDGEGILIVDQSPARLIPDAIKNTNLKLTHRLVAEDDRDAIASCMTLNAEQKAIINRLRPGQAILFGDQDDMAAWVQVAES